MGFRVVRWPYMSVFVFHALLGIVVMSGYLVKPSLLKVEESFDNKSVPFSSRYA